MTYAFYSAASKTGSTYVDAETACVMPVMIRETVVYRVPCWQFTVLFCSRVVLRACVTRIRVCYGCASCVMDRTEQYSTWRQAVTTSEPQAQAAFVTLTFLQLTIFCGVFSHAMV